MLLMSDVLYIAIYVVCVVCVIHVTYVYKTKNMYHLVLLAYRRRFSPPDEKILCFLHHEEFQSKKTKCFCVLVIIEGRDCKSM